MREQRQKLWLQWRRMEKSIRAKDELYDVSMLRGYHCKNDGYGELLPCFSKQLAEVLNITATDKVLDVGSGIGFLCFDLACLSGCNVRGIEIRRDIYLKSVQIANHVSERMKLDVSFVYGDATGDSVSFKNIDILVCCNTLWSGENNYRLLQKLCLQMRPGTRVVVLEQLGGQRFHEKSPRQQNDILSACFHVPPQKYMSQPESVSWTSNPIPFYVYTKKSISREMKDRVEQERVTVLKTPKHRTDPHVAEMAAKRKRLLTEGGDENVAVCKRMRREGDDEDLIVISDDDDQPTKRVTRSSKLLEVRPIKRMKKGSKDTKGKKGNGRVEDDKENQENGKMVKPAVKKRKKAPYGVVTTKIRRRTKATIAKRQLKLQQQQLLQKQQQQLQDTEEPRKTRSQAKAELESSSSPSSPSSPTTRSQSSSKNESKATKDSTHNFDKPRRRPALAPINGMNVSERRSQRNKKFNMHLNDFIA